MLALRSASIEDAVEIARLAGELGYPMEATTMAARLRATLPLPQHRVTVAPDEHEGLRGWIAVERRLALESGEHIEIVGLVVDAATRGKSIGRALVADAEHWALAQGFDAIGVRSNILRDGSHPFYESLGYLRAKTQHAYRKPLK